MLQPDLDAYADDSTENLLYQTVLVSEVRSIQSHHVYLIVPC
jgi:hypothetical protein